MGAIQCSQAYSYKSSEEGNLVSSLILMYKPYHSGSSAIILLICLGSATGFIVLF